MELTKRTNTVKYMILFIVDYYIDILYTLLMYYIYTAYKADILLNTLLI